MLYGNTQGHTCDGQTYLDVLLVWSVRDIARQYDCELVGFDLDKLQFDIRGERENEAADAIVKKLEEWRKIAEKDNV